MLDCTVFARTAWDIQLGRAFGKSLFWLEELGCEGANARVRDAHKEGLVGSVRDLYARRAILW